MAQLNYHHLHYFWAVAKEGHLTKAAQRLHVSQSALSSQIKQLEEQFGQALFVREARRLRLTEAGHLALTYAETIFGAGTELLAVMRDGAVAERQVLRLGAVATLSKNFQENFIRPLLGREDVELVLQSGSLSELLGRLRVHALDVVLTNRKVHADANHPWRCRRVARQAVSLVGRPRKRGQKAFRFPDDVGTVPLLLPGRDNDIRTGFDLICEQHGLHPRILAEVDDMALLRLLARDTDAVALLPTVVVQDELKAGRLVELAVVPELVEVFYAVTLQRQFEPPLLKALLKRSEAAVLGPPQLGRTMQAV